MQDHGVEWQPVQALHQIKRCEDGKKQLPVEKSVDVAQVAALSPHLTEEKLGRMLFELTAAAQAKGLDPEDALRKHANKVMRDVEARLQPTTA